MLWQWYKNWFWWNIHSPLHNRDHTRNTIWVCSTLRCYIKIIIIKLCVHVCTVKIWLNNDCMCLWLHLNIHDIISVMLEYHLHETQQNLVSFKIAGSFSSNGYVPTIFKIRRKQEHLRVQCMWARRAFPTNHAPRDKRRSLDECFKTAYTLKKRSHCLQHYV